MRVPLVSVVMIVRDGQATLPLAVASLILQTFPDWECIVINDNSTDQTQPLLDNLRDGRFKVRHHARPLGRGQARAEALAECRGSYIATLDADDFYFPETLLKHVMNLEKHPEIAASVGPVLLFGEDEELLGRLRRHPRPGLSRIPIGPHEIKLPFGSMVLRKKVLGKLQYNTLYNRSEDRDLYTRALAGRTVSVLDRPTYAYRWDLSLPKVLAGLKENQKIYASHFSQAPLQTVLLVGFNRLKYEIYRLLGTLRLWNYTNMLRIAPADFQEQTSYNDALGRIKILARQVAK